MDKWETVIKPNVLADQETCRLKVEGGWLYRYGDKTMEFVPFAEAKFRLTPIEPHALPSMHRKTPVPANPDFVDADYTEVGAPQGESNG